MDDGINRHLKKLAGEINPHHPRAKVNRQTTGEIKHEHQFTIPVEWDHQGTSYSTEAMGSYYVPEKSNVTKLRCPCGEETSR